MSFVMLEFEIVSGSEENDGMDITNTAMLLIVGVSDASASDVAKSLISVTGIFVVFTPLSVAR
jgi:hypothetical protein